MSTLDGYSDQTVRALQKIERAHRRGSLTYLTGAEVHALVNSPLKVVLRAAAARAPVGQTLEKTRKGQPISAA